MADRVSPKAAGYAAAKRSSGDAEAKGELRGIGDAGRILWVAQTCLVPTLSHRAGLWTRGG